MSKKPEVDEAWEVELEGDDLRDTYASDAQGRYAVCLADYPDPNDAVCSGHVEFVKWVNWALTQPPDDGEHKN